MNFKVKKAYYRLFSVFLSLVMIVISVPIVSIGANAVDEDFSGIWLFNNVKYDAKFIHINDNNGTNQEGEIIELNNYNKYWALRWYIISVGGGYYKIESVISHKVLTAPTGYNNDIVTQTTYTGANTQLWKFIKQSDGTYKISPKSNHNCYLVAGAVYSGFDQDLEIRSAQTDNTDKWNLIDINYQYHASIQHYYDGGYYWRFIGVPSDIQNYQNICSQILLELFNVKVTYSVKLFESSADVCKGDYNTTAECTHKDYPYGPTIDHKTPDILRSNITYTYGDGNMTTARVIWTGHVLSPNMSSFNTGDNTILMTIGMVTDSQNNYSNHPSSVIFNQRIYTLLHETSHFLGAVDHYCYENPVGACSNNNCFRCKKNSNPPNCLMTGPVLDLATRLNNGTLSGTYCSYCTGNTYDHSIAKHLSDHH